MITISGYAKPIERLRTQLFSFDKAFRNARGNFGFPLGMLSEWYGPTFVGKSTIIYGLSALIAKELNTNIALLDLEMFDPEFLVDVCSTMNFSGDVFSITETTDEASLDALIDKMWEDYGVGIIDSVGAISPIAERQDDLGAAAMGRRAKLMAAFSRKAIYLCRSCEDHKNVFLTNHQHLPISAFAKKPIAPGGETKGFLSSMRVHITRNYIGTKEDKFSDGSYAIKGVVLKNRWGIANEVFYLFNLSGRGVHLGMSALYDVDRLGLTKRIRGFVKSKEINYGRFSQYLKLAKDGKDDEFEPFFEILKEEENKFLEILEEEKSKEPELNLEDSDDNELSSV